MENEPQLPIRLEMCESTPDLTCNEKILDITLEEHEPSGADTATNAKLESDGEAQHLDDKGNDEHNEVKDDIDIIEGKLTDTHISEIMENFEKNTY